MKQLLVVVASRLTALEASALRASGFAVPYSLCVPTEQRAIAAVALSEWLLNDLRRAS